MDLPRIFYIDPPKNENKIKILKERRDIGKYAGYSLIPAGHSRQDISSERVRCVGVRTPLGVANPLPVFPLIFGKLSGLKSLVEICETKQVKSA